jgi:magnesium transporter
MFDEQQLLQRIVPLLERGESKTIAELLKEQRSSDIAEVIELLDNEQKLIIYDALDIATGAEVLEKVEQAVRAELFELFEDERLAGFISNLDPDDAADVLMELPEERCARILEIIPDAESKKIRDLMLYSEDTAGGIMDSVLISVRENTSVAEAIGKIRSAEINEDFFSIFVVDKHGRFVGDVRIRYLLTSPEETLIADLIDPDAIYVTVDTDQEEVRNIFSKNDLIVLPVLSRGHKLVGRITADRVIEVAEDEAAEDLYTMAGTDPDELDKDSILHAARIRMTWLLPCLIGTSVTALVMMFFKNLNPTIFVAAAAFVPMIAAISGNAGLQTSAIVVSGLATGHLAALKLGQVFGRETRIALLVAASCGIIGGLFCLFLLNWRHVSDNIEPIRIVFAFGIGMFTAIVVATTLGLMLPFLFRRVGIDPAISSGPLVTTANDSISVAIYLTLTLLLAA